MLESGEYDSVATRRVTRTGESRIRSFFVRMFYKIINKIPDIHFENGAQNVCQLKTEVNHAIWGKGGCNRFSRGKFRMDRLSDEVASV